MFKKLMACSLLLLSAMFCGCRSHGTVTSYLVLPDAELKLAEAQPGTSQDKVFLQRVSFPSYLHRREMVCIVDGDQVETVSRSRWAVDFERSATSVLNRNLQVLLGERYGCQRCAKRRYELAFSRFELDEDDTLHVEGVCRDLETCEKKPLSIQFTLDGADYDNPARAHGAALSKVAVLLSRWM